MKIRSIKFGLAAVLLSSVAIVCYHQIIASFNGDAAVMSVGQQPHFTHHCISESGSEVLDDAGVLSVAVWNIYKQQKPNWQQQLHALATKDLVLLQEAKLNQALNQQIVEVNKHAVMAKGFAIRGVTMGVMTLSNSKAQEACAYQSTEPWIRFAKSTLVSRYPLSNGQTLLVVNLHGVNFDWRLSSYQAQWGLVAKQLQVHSGPIIVAGDFNTWRAGRMAVVSDFAAQYDLISAKFQHDYRSRVLGQPLDHLFYRGLQLVQASATPSTASDHNPITAKFNLDN
ncbi:endonuclease/exonuclease/phosphatase family protein [Shewanella waksmanii]|uniref:endonuclease/exonuclease/phosphatase family protein n=1 Tax=Shewanella waksmanii TaxID=213783 RepID=UPI000491CD70|nr:endonuclease/exonuclease/phosphatase family protein [Shewanella waksmanii]